MRRLFTLLVLTFAFTFGAFSQKSYVNYDKDSRWFFGINGGATWHTKTEVDNLIHGGYGFTFGRSFGMRSQKLFSWDLRLRYLHGWWGGQNTSPYTLDSTTTGLSAYNNNLQTYQDSLGYFIPNFRTQLMSGSLELALNTNRLRENTGWNFQIFGGLGIKAYNAKADLFDGSGNIYDYDNINTSTKTSILKEQDGNYETYVTGGDGDYEVDWMGSFGVGISYQVAPWASIGISHKMTWTRNDDKFDILPGTGNDIYHYSSAGIKFHLFGGHHDTHVDHIIEDSVDINNFDNADNITPPPPVQKPIVDIYDPGVSPYTVDYDHFTIRAYVHNVAGRQNITFKQNGNINNNFSYNVASDEFSSNVVLQAGQNIFEITGVNEAGQDYESTIIIYKKDVPVVEPPIVTITNPPYSPYTTANSTFSFASTVLNVDSKSQIKVYVNGNYTSDFTYNVTSKGLNSTLNLQEGTNTVTVTATNSAGSDSKTATIIYEKPQVKQPPIVDFIVPSTDPYTTTQSSMNITASVLNVDSKNDIKVTVNGFAKTNFTYNASTKQVTFPTALIEGANIIAITGTNSVGSDHEATTIIYNRPEAPKPPVVTYLDPITDPTVVFTSSYNVVAQVLNVNSASDIKLKINGIQSYNFAYSASSKQMTFTTNLLLGSNVIEITATNNAGTDSESTTIIRKKVVPKAPPIVDISYPATDNQVFNTPNITLVSTVLNVDNASNIQVWVNGNSTNGFGYNIATKVLTLPLNMVEGTNTVKITGTNSAGSDTKTRTIVYKKPVVPAPPTVSFVNPPSSPYLVNAQNYTITANTTNIDSKSQITLLLNGQLVQGGFYTLTANKQILFNTDLIEGNNVFEITVTNQDGSASAMAIVTYKVDVVNCIIPTVGYISPVPYSTVNSPAVTIDAQINNWSTGTSVELFVNGVSQGLMAYNSGTSIASKATTLQEGSNAIKVQVTNDCGRNHATFTLNYVAPEAPCLDPILTPNSPVAQTTQSNTASVQAGVTGITTSNQIAVTLNGVAVAFQYDQGTGTINVNNVQLALGNNTILVTATNDCGNATTSFNIVREECKLPLVSNPSHASGFTSNAPSISFTASIANVDASQIELIVNNISQPFNFSNGVLSSGINLNEGSNSIVINATNACGNTTKTYDINYVVPCVPITVSLVSPTTNQITVTNASFNIQLHVNGSLTASGISATLNGSAVNATYDAVAGDISINGLTLVNGSNTIVVNLTNDCSSKTVTYNVTYNGCQPPVISVSNITSGSTVNTSTIDLIANIQNSNGASNIQLTVNGTTNSFNFDDQSNTLTSTIDLIEGSNSIVITVNGCQVKTQTINVTYTVPCQDVSYSLMTPATTNQTVVDANYAITLNLLEVSGPQQITVSHNGNTRLFSFDAGTHILSINGITLVNGANTIVVNASNACSSKTITYSIQYNGCQPPVITLGSNPASVTTSLYNFTASVTNINNQNDIQVLLNNVPVNIVFDAQSGSISGEVNLNEGTNTIKITANGCQVDTKSFNVTYTVPCNPIVYALSTPAQTETSVADDTYAITLVAQNANANSITVSFNGQSVPFTYNSDIITINGLNLIEGDNNVVVNISNACSSETVTYLIHHNGCNAPVITLGANSSAVTTAAYTFSANISNVSNQSDITLKLNGNNVPFTFTNGNLSAQMTLVEGANTVSLVANGCANANETFTVNYTIPCDPVTYTLGSPATQQSAVNTSSTTITLNVNNVSGQSFISAKLNGATVPFTYANNLITLSNIALLDGNNTIEITFSNDCSTETVTYTIDSDQCVGPVITVPNNNVTTNDALYTFICNVQNISNASEIELKVNGQVVTFNYANGGVTAQISLQEGPNEVMVTANGCETTSVTYNIVYQLPCTAPVITVSSPTTTSSAAYTFTAAVTNVDGASNITVKHNGNVVQHTYSNGSVTANVTLTEGANTITVDAVGCQTVNISHTVDYSVAACGPRFNPGNSEWEFCLITPNGTYNRDDLHNNPNFTYSGPATSAYFKPIAGGGDAIVNGSPYAVQNGQYYLFQGNLTVDVSSSHPGSMGHWEICITSNTVPQYGNGNNKPESPCVASQPEPEHNDDINVNNNGSVQLSSNFCANIKCLGESVVYNNNQDAFVKVQYSIDGGTTWYYFNNDNNVNGGENITVQAPTGSNIVLRAVCTNAQGNWSNTETSNTGSQYVYVLQNGDHAPNFAPAQGQASVETFLAGYVDGQGNVTIGPNDVIYLYELRFVGNIGIDYQDCVMLISMTEGSSCSPPPSSEKVGTKINNNNSNGDPNGNRTDPNNTGNNNTQTNLTPTITNVNPATTSVTSDKAVYDFKVSLGNVKSPNDITLTVNGVKSTAFKFNGNTNELTQSVNLKVGANTIKVEATNGANKANRTYTINYKPTTGVVENGGNNNTLSQSPPKITNINPATTSVKSAVATYSFKAKVENINSQSDIKLAMNGASISGFTYNDKTKEVSVVLRLNSGVNTISLTATSNGKSDSRTYTITYTSTTVEQGGTMNTNSGGTMNTNSGGTTVTKVGPTIKKVAPATESVESTSASYTFKANVANVSSKADIQLTVNGKTITNFTYSSGTGLVTAVISLQNGTNQIRLIAKNEANTATENFTITYKAAVINSNGGTIKTGGNTGGGTTNGGGTTTNGGTIKTGGGTTTNGGTTTTGGTIKNGGTTTNTGGGTTTNGGTIKTGGGTTTNGGTTTTGGTIKNGGTTTNTGGGTTTNGGTIKTGGGTTTNGGTTTTGGTIKNGGTTTNSGGSTKQGGTTTTGGTTSRRG
ncbi:MAG: hypothetical protein H6582_06860 [Crocinitomicaceae bacterium]|nr:hypothetical protein [Crocinitomicaceae bacterium]